MVLMFFLVLYIILSVVLIIVFWFLKRLLFSRLWLGLPFLFASVIIFPVFLVLLGYCLRIYDEKRMERKEQAYFYEQNRKDYSDGYISAKVGRN